MRKINVLYLDHSNDFSGGQVSLVTLLQQLDRSKFNPIVVLDKNASLLKEKLTENSIPFYEAPFHKIRYWNFPVFIRLGSVLKKIIKKDRIDLLHANTFLTGMLVILLRLIFFKRPLIFRARLAIQYHGHGFIDHIIYKQSDLILANSFYVQKCFEDRYGKRSNIITVYNPINFNSKIDRSRPTSKIFYFGVVGRIESIKRHMDIVGAVEVLSRSNLEFKVLVIGGATKLDNGVYYRQVLDAINQKGLDRYFEWTDFLKDPRPALGRLDACIFCSIGEALSRGIYECQLYEIPVLASESGGNLELITDRITGFLFNSGDCEDLAKKMSFLLEHQHSQMLKSIASCARQQVDDLFRIENTIKKEESQYLELFKKLIE